MIITITIKGTSLHRFNINGILFTIEDLALIPNFIENKKLKL